MTEFMLILHGTPFEDGEVPPERREAIMRQYREWREGLEKEGRLVGGRKLSMPARRTIRKRRGKVRAIDGPFVESKEVVSGYFIVRAEDWDDAERIAVECPHVGLGLGIELREVEFSLDELD